MHLLAKALVERSERLVEQQHIRIEHEPARQGHPLLLAARQLAKILAREGAEPDQVQDLAHADGLITATVAEPPPTYATVTSGTVDDVLARLGAFTRFTRIFNSIGLPALSVPSGFTADRLPLGMQIIGRPFKESTVLRVAYAYEQATHWHLRRPPC